MSQDKPAILVDEKAALDLFLEALLRETEPAVEAPVETPAEPAVETVTETPAAPPVTEARTETETPVEEATDTETALQTEAEVEPLPPGVPEWAREPFQAMLFKVAGLTLAVPLESLSGVVEWPDKLTEMPGHADFFLGLLTHLDTTVPVVDTARLVFPADRLPPDDDPLARVTRIVLIGGGRWGLACDAVAEVVTLRHDQVRWRSERTRRRWLLGTVIDHMCALIDTDAFAEKLASGEE